MSTVISLESAIPLKEKSLFCFKHSAVYKKKIKCTLFVMRRTVSSKHPLSSHLNKMMILSSLVLVDITQHSGHPVSPTRRIMMNTKCASHSNPLETWLIGQRMTVMSQKVTSAKSKVWLVIKLPCTSSPPPPPFLLPHAVVVKVIFPVSNKHTLNRSEIFFKHSCQSFGNYPNNSLFLEM